MSERAFNATMNMMGMYGAFFNVVAQKIGMEKAIDLMSKADENLGASLGKMTKEQMGIKALDVPTASAIMNGMAETYGITSEIIEEPNTVIVKNCSHRSAGAGGMKALGIMCGRIQRHPQLDHHFVACDDGGN